ncbi:MAG: hypothetical protein KF726_04905 [Anaerolineae bacterium]|nr:hypothetical protein [Anaerolineae bacterium]
MGELTSATRTLLLLSTALTIVTVILTHSSVRAIWQEWGIFRKGIVTTGKITAISKHSFWRRPEDKIYFRFTVVTDHEQRYTVAQQVYPKHLLDMQVNQEVELKYLPATPKIARLSGANADNLMLDNAILRIFTSAGLGLLTVAQLWVLLRR